MSAFAIESLYRLFSSGSEGPFSGLPQIKPMDGPIGRGPIVPYSQIGQFRRLLLHVFPWPNLRNA